VNASFRWATFVAFVSVVLSNTPTATVAQQPTTQPPGSAARGVAPMQQAGDKLAVIDINYIFKNHDRFKQMAKDWKGDVQRAEAEMKAQNSGIANGVEELKRWEPGSAEFKNLEESIAQKRADLQVKMQIKKKNLMLREAKMYLEVYNEIREQVAYFSRQNGITLVLRFSSGQVNSEDPRQIQTALLKPVVFQDRIDITQSILNRLNPPRNAKRTQPQQNTPGRTTTNPRSR